MTRYNNNNKSLDTVGTIHWLLTLVKPVDVTVSGSRQITGLIEHDYVVISNFRVMAEMFANWQTNDASILRFTKRYGPLFSEWVAGARLSFDTNHWREWQQVYQKMWRTMIGFQLDRSHGFRTNELDQFFRQIPLPTGTFLRYHKGSAALLLPDVKAALDVCFMLIPPEDLRICKAEECKRPYFIANRSDQVICDSTDCKAWNIRRLKREWFDREKGPILAERKRLRRENGTQKAR